ncbi:unnamed protein product [Linum trigynum]
MDEEWKRTEVTYMSEVYNASLKAGIDSPNRSGNFRNSREGEGSRSSQSVRDRLRSGDYYRQGVECDGAAARVGGVQEGRNSQVPPGFTIRRIDMWSQNREEQENQGRQRGRYREEMGARNLNLELEKTVAAMEGSLLLEEEGFQGSADQIATEVETVETGLTLESAQQVEGEGGSQNVVNLGPTDIYICTSISRRPWRRRWGAG